MIECEYLSAVFFCPIFLWLDSQNDPMKKVCKNRKNCGKIEITQEGEFLWKEENESQ